MKAKLTALLTALGLRILHALARNRYVRIFCEAYATEVERQYEEAERKGREIDSQGP